MRSFLISMFVSATSLTGQVVFPKPTGPYPVGTTLMHWVDESREEVLTPEDGDKRELVVQLWYPTTKQAKGEAIHYLPHFDELRVVLSSQFRMFERKFKRARVPAIVGAPPLAKGKRMPIIVFSHGLGTSRLFYTSQILELASHGYCVASLDHTYDVEGTVCPGPYLVQRVAREESEAEKSIGAVATKPASERLKVWAADLSFIVDRLAELASPRAKGPFKRRLDLTRVGVIGHCYGGEAAMLACSRDKRFKAVGNENGWPPATEVAKAGLRQPLMFIWGMESSAVAFLRAKGVDAPTIAKLSKQFHDLQTRILRSLKTKVYQVELAGQKHMDFSDLPMVGSWVGKKGKDAVMELPPRLGVVNQHTVAFFDTVLRNKTSKLLKATPSPIPGVTLHVFDGKK